MQEGLAAIEGDLLNRPRDLAALLHAAREVVDADPEKTWMEALPFPLGSVAWRYRADADVKDKVGHLLHFFEASACFFATVLLSAFVADEDLLAAERSGWGDEQGLLRLDRATFGTWTHLGAQMAAGARRRFSSAEDEGAVSEQMRSAFALASPGFRDLVTSKELWKLLTAVTDERNDEAHGGIDSRQQRAEQLERLQAELLMLRALSASVLGEVRLIRPGDGGARRGIFRYGAAEDLSGFVDTFAARQIESTQSLDAEELYLIDVSDEPVRGGLRLLPFVRMAAAPADEEVACYFFNRRSSAGAEYVSYHFAREARTSIRDEELDTLLDKLTAPSQQG